MPTVLRQGAYRVYFYSHEPGEPAHVHVDRDRLSSKFWLQPVRIGSNHGFGPRELRVIETIVKPHQGLLLKAWNDYFGT